MASTDIAKDITSTWRHRAGWTTTADGTIKLPSIVQCVPGTGILLKVVGPAAMQREWGYDQARLLARNGKLQSIETSEMEIVMENRMPFKKGTREHVEDKGLHCTFLACYGESKEVIPEGAMKFHGQEFELEIDMKDIHFVQGNPTNDDACRLVFRICASLTEETKERVNKLRSDMGSPMKPGEWPHVTLAAVAPLWTRDLMAVLMMRMIWAPIWPTDESFPQPQKQLERNCRRCQQLVQLNPLKRNLM
jgi:hypothetical protein